MSGIPGASDELQPKTFAFTPENREEAARIVAKYPPGRQASAVMGLLHLAQRQHGWLPRAAVEHVADMLAMPSIRVWEVATFYTMYLLNPVGKYVLGVCTTTPCWLAGSDEVVAACRRKLGIDWGGTTPDGQFTMLEVECLGACVNAPMMSVNDEYYEDLDGPRTEALLERLARDDVPPPGSLNGRTGSEPITGAMVLRADRGHGSDRPANDRPANDRAGD